MADPTDAELQGNDSRRQLLSVLLLCTVGACAYLNALGGPFIFDDTTSIPQNLQIRQLWPPWALWSSPPDLTVSGRPVVTLTLAINYALGGVRVEGYHAVNVLLHVCSGLLLFGVVRRTLSRLYVGSEGGERARWLALATAAIWLVHPLQTEAVNYVIQRTELLVSLFYLLTLFTFIRAAGASPRRRRWLLLLSAGVCALGMASKEVMVTCPVMILLYDRIFIARSWGGVFRRRLLYHCGLALTWLVLASLIVGGPRSATVGFHFEGLSSLDYARTQLSVIAHYLRLSVWPHPLVLDYGDWRMAGSFSSPLASGVLIGALAALTLVLLRRRPAAGYLGMWFFVILSPSSSVVPIASEIAAERRMYLPLAAVLLAVVLAGASLGDRLGRGRPGAAPRLVAGGLVIAVIAALFLVTMHRNDDYATAIRIWRDAVDKIPGNPRAREGLGGALMKAGRLEQALVQLRRSLRLSPAAGVHNAIGCALARQGKVAEARRHLLAALKMSPGHAEAHFNLANILARAGQRRQAIAHYREAHRLSPNDVTSVLYQGRVHDMDGKPRRAIPLYRQVLRSNPDHLETLHALASALVRTGQLDRAIVTFGRARARAPKDPHLLNNFGVALARSGDARQAKKLFRAALAVNPTFRKAHRNLGIALANEGRMDEARYHLARGRPAKP